MAALAPGRRGRPGCCTERELVRAPRPRPAAGGAPRRRGLRFRPDGELLLPTGERLAVEVELHDKAERLADKLAWYRDAAGYAEVLWLVPGPGVEGPLWAAIEPPVAPRLMAVETLPPECLVYVR